MPRLNPQLPWGLTQFFLRLITFSLSFASLIFFLAAAALFVDKILTNSDNDYNSTITFDWFALIPLGWSCIWCGYLITICLRSAASNRPGSIRCCSIMPHPGVIVTVELFIWGGLSTMVAFTVIGSAILLDADIYQACPDYNYYHQLAYYCTPAYQSMKILEIFGFSTMIISSFLHMASFVFACRQTHNLRMMKKRERARVDHAIELNGRAHGTAIDLELPVYFDGIVGGCEAALDHKAAGKVGDAKVASV